MGTLTVGGAPGTLASVIVRQLQIMFTASNSNPTMVGKPHNHHAYFRFDFDIDGWQNDVIEYYNSTDNKWHIIAKEMNQKHSKTSTKWRVRDKVKNIGYEVIPSVEDHLIQDAWSVADIWALHYHPNELDDGTGAQGTASDPAGNAAHMNNQINGENIDGQDVVLWYRVGHRHAGASTCGHAGPTLRPFGKW
jgi:Cu2+-containing amine oxidase